LISTKILGLSAACFIVIVGFMAFAGEYVGVGINLTASAPRGVYLYYPITRSLALGGYVDFALPANKRQISHGCIQSGEYGLKKVGALPGEWLFSRGRSIYACSKQRFNSHCRFLGRCLLQDRFGRAIHCQHWLGKQIPRNSYYLLSQRTLRSCDSRYFGLIERRSIRHRVEQLIASF